MHQVAITASMVLRRVSRCSAFRKSCRILKSLQDLGEDEVTGDEWLIQQQAVELLGLRIGDAAEVVDPDTGIDENH